MTPSNHEAASLSGEHVEFSFGENWQQYLRGFNATKLAQAQESLVASFDGAELKDHTFLDVGCGSGAFSLAARRLGAKVTSVDVDPASIACAQRLRQGDPSWTVIQASVLDPSARLPEAERVYAWGVLHHTGAMWQAVDRTLDLVAPGGLACIALYNRPTRLEVHIRLKRLYNRMGKQGRRLLKYAYGSRLLARGLLLHGRNPIRHVRAYGETSRGMTFWRDVDDWLGGLPFEFTDSTEFQSRLPGSFEVVAIIERPPGSCNEYLLHRSS